jgi:hypothetical protein
MKASKHAAVRSKQRRIPYDCIDIILQFGTPKEKPGKTFEYLLTKKDRQKAFYHMKHMIQLLDKAGNKAVLMSGDIDNIITVYNRTS